MLVDWDSLSHWISKSGQNSKYIAMKSPENVFEPLEELTSERNGFGRVTSRLFACNRDMEQHHTHSDQQGMRSVFLMNPRLEVMVPQTRHSGIIINPCYIHSLFFSTSSGLTAKSLPTFPNCTAPARNETVLRRTHGPAIPDALNQRAIN